MEKTWLTYIIKSIKAHQKKHFINEKRTYYMQSCNVPYSTMANYALLDGDCLFELTENIISNCRVKFISINSWGKFGSFFVAHWLDKHRSSVGCRAPPISSVF